MPGELSARPARAVPGWEGALSHSIEQALKRDLALIAPLERHGRQVSEAAGDLLRALA